MGKGEEETEFDEILSEVELQVKKGKFAGIIRGATDTWSYGAGDKESESQKEGEII